MAEYIFEISEALYDEQTGEAVMKPEFKGKLVRCKDCKCWTDKNSGYCDVWGEYISNEEFFCAYGERRENDGSD